MKRKLGRGGKREGVERMERQGESVTVREKIPKDSRILPTTQTPSTPSLSLSNPSFPTYTQTPSTPSLPLSNPSFPTYTQTTSIPSHTSTPQLLPSHTYTQTTSIPSHTSTPQPLLHPTQHPRPLLFPPTPPLPNPFYTHDHFYSLPHFYSPTPPTHQHPTLIPIPPIPTTNSSWNT
ncbi:hypothetical protein Pcinc_034247 [Petrolisthes cinctipes]|uniref:Uncharacterized protein n=1 Tax=Petrolisthes cinctipes TaxID=88211 RepID=A0AAE1JVZ2_PETCI|nr:hypothetical protein Pcinc_034247 [Petrolisthes cinctipes]